MLVTAVTSGIAAVYSAKAKYLAENAAEDAKLAVRVAKTVSDKAEVSQGVVGDIKDLAIKTETQTNSRLSELDKRVQMHEIKCIESARQSADQQRQIAELKLALAEEKAKRIP